MSIKSTLPIVTCLFATALGCAARQQPQVLPPVNVAVRVDSTAMIPQAEARSGVTTAEDDPFFRIDRMDFPGPNQYRSANGAPGPSYWQQRADYDIAATLDTTTQSVQGRVTIRYTNNSPDTLDLLWLQLEQNLYAPGSLGAAINPAGSRWGARNFAGGYRLTNVRVNDREATYAVDDTRMRVTLADPLPPTGGSATVSMEFAFTVPEHGSDRMGRDGTLYEMAQWYPRVAVYDDVRGWNTEPYLGQGEFYLEYGDYTFAVTAPAGYVVAASGVLQNPGDVLTAAQRERLTRAAGSSEVVPIITAAEASPRPAPGTKTWRFRAERVRDVAWAAAPDFRWDAASWNGILTQAYYPWPRAGAGWENGAENTLWSIRTYSEMFYPYPYPQATSVAGPVGGMEYPMFVMVHYAEEPQGAFGTIDHEHGHEWFPMIVGSNERRYAWMDEGLNTLLNAYSMERRYASRDASAWPLMIRNWRDVVARGIQSPLATPPDRIDRAALGAIGYRKPAAVMLTLRNHVVGPELFDAALREYIERWAFKHPTPADFFRTVEGHTGHDLSWFWRGFVYSDDVLDIAIDSVTMREIDGQTHAVVALRRVTTIPFPVALRLRLSDGSTTDVRLPVQIWGGGDRYDATIAVPGGVVGARLWPDPTVPDWDATNDVWGSAPDADRLGPVTRERATP
jgi:hypothetical protein